MTKTRRGRRPDWSKLHGYLLWLILEKLDLVAHSRFASVCSSWRSVAVENPPVSKPLYFALSHEPEILVRRFITSFVPNWKEARFIGALDGWLVILIDDRDLFLLNKGSNSWIPLPPLPAGSTILSETPFLYKAVLSSPPSSSSSSNECICTVVIKHLEAGVFYCRLGLDGYFTELSNCPQRPQDILFYKGRLYVLAFPKTIIIFDHLLNKVSQLAADLVNDDAPSRLLVSGNNIMYVIGGRLRQYSVFTLDGSERRVVQVNNIGDILLSNRYCSLSITTKEHKEFRRATNYFENDFSTFVLDISKDPNKAKADDPWPLFFVVFSFKGIKNLV